MKKFLLTLCIIAMLVCAFAIISNAEAPSLYIEFGVKLSGADNYIDAYVENPEKGNPRINLTFDFYSDVEFTQIIDKNEIVAMDFSNAVHYGNAKDYVDRFTKASPSLYPNCTEVKWFSRVFTSAPNGIFENWTQLKTFDFGCLTFLDYGFLANTGLENVVLPASITNLNNGVFQNCLSLKTVKIEGAITTMGSNQFGGCTALTSLDLGASTVIGGQMCKGCTSLESIVIPSTITSIGNEAFSGCTGLENAKISEGITVVGENMFNGCSSLASVELPSTITEIKASAFKECTALTSITIPDSVTSIGNYAFYKAGLLSLHIPANVTKLGYQVAEESAIKSLTFAPNSSLTFIDHRAFMNCYSLEGTVILPDGLEEIDYALFSGCSKLKAVKIPDSVTKYTENKAMFTSCSSLEFVQLSKNVNTIPGSMFENCTSLKAISIPEGVTIMGNKSLRNCTSLEAIYLPSTLTTLGTEDSGTDKGVFYQSKKIYFVDEPFNVFDGDTLIGDSFVMPEKPSVYFMPKDLNYLGNSEFQDCKALNSCIVFPEGVTSLATCAQGAFHGTGAADSPKTYVFLGDITDFQIRQNDATYSNVSFVFANANDKDLNSFSFVVGSSGTNKLQSNTYMYFCNGNVVYDLSSFKAPNSTDYTVAEADFAKTENTAQTQPHITDPSKEFGYVEADCLNNSGVVKYCFCGAVSEKIDEENTALGHEFNLENGAKILSLTYTNYFASGDKSTKCARCDVTEETKADAIIIDFKGFSTKEDGNGITFGYYLDEKALVLFESVNKFKLEFGFVVAVKSFVNGNAPLNADGTVAETTRGSVIKAVASSQTANYSGYDFKLTGTWDKMVDLDGDNVDETDIKDVEFYMAGYVFDGNVSYIQSETATSATVTAFAYNDIK